MSETPEEQARRTIDRMLTECGWTVQRYAAMNIMARPGVAVSHFPLQSGEADYLLYADGKAIGTVEAKPAGHTLTGVEVQSAKYLPGLPDAVPSWGKPLPFAYESTGVETQFTSLLDPHPRSRLVFSFHRPEELIHLARLGNWQLRQRLREMPELVNERLWRVQREAIQNLETSLANDRPRALIQMATGSGKTYTACAFCYRLVKHAGARRILFLVDRNNLGVQTQNEFQQYQNADTGYRFSEEFNVQRLRSNTIDPVSKVCITTIQRLFSILKGEPEYAEENEEQSMFLQPGLDLGKPVEVAYTPAVPIETFDFIVVDECHRSIYNLWRQVLEYFDAFIIGLTATPSKQTVGFFDQNVVQSYTHEQAVIDRVNVDFEVYRIATRITEQGATLEKQPGHFVPVRDRRTRERRLIELDDDLTYPPSQLDRDVVSEGQIRLVIQTFHDRLFTEIFPGRTEVPKTLVFAKTDNHADDIVRIIREEFGKGDDFCQKITYRTTGKKPEDLLSEFRNSYNPRIAVTVDMIATGTDVKPLECLLFMRDVKSASFFEQMKGRGSRVIKPSDLQTVTPDAKAKTHFVIIDAVGVCESIKTDTKPIDRQPGLSFDQVLQRIAQGIVSPDLVSTLAARLARLEKETDPEQDREIAAASGGKDLPTFSRELLDSINPDMVEQEARGKFAVEEPTEKQLDEVERERMAEALKPFHDPKLRDLLSAIRAKADQVIDEVTEDELQFVGTSDVAKQKAAAKIADFRQFIEENREEIEALQVLYSRPYRAGLRFKQVKDLAAALERPPLSLVSPAHRLWELYRIVEPDKVQGYGGSQLVDLIALVRHAIDPEEPIVPVVMTVEERYRKWLGEQKARGIDFTPEQLRWLDAIRDHIATSLRIDQGDFDYPPLYQLGGLGGVTEVFGDRLSEILDELNERLAA